MDDLRELRDKMPNLVGQDIAGNDGNFHKRWDERRPLAESYNARHIAAR
jgi:hypothetical protein